MAQLDVQYPDLGNVLMKAETLKGLKNRNLLTELKIQEAMELTLGMRYDHYSDFGSTINPRAAFVWNVLPAMYLKFLYGRAFLAPSFHEYYLKNTPLIVGSQDLDQQQWRPLNLGQSILFLTI